MKKHNIELIEKHRALQELLQVTALKESGSPKLITHTVLVCVALFGFILVWASLSPMKEVSTATGTVVPTGRLPVVQHLEGGIISQIHVEDGQHVEKNQLLVNLQPTRTLSDLKRLKVKEFSLRLQIERLNAFVDGHNINYEDYIKKIGIPNQLELPKIKKLIYDNIALLAQSNQSRLEEKKLIQNQIKKIETNSANLQSQVENLKSRKAILNEEVKMYKKLTKTQFAPKINLLKSQDKLVETHGELLELIGAWQKSKSELQEMKDKLINLDTTYIENAIAERTKLNAELLDVIDTLGTHVDRAKRLEIRAPVTGIVKGLTLESGSVIQPGGIIMELIPLDRPLQVEAKVSPKDIGHIKIKDKVKIKVSSYHFVRYGQLSGEVSAISASTFIKDDGTPYYKVLIKLDSQFLGKGEHKKLIMPGMTATVDIITGNKTLLAYLLRPIKSSLDTSFSER